MLLHSMQNFESAKLGLGGRDQINQDGVPATRVSHDQMEETKRMEHRGYTCMHTHMHKHACTHAHAVKGVAGKCQVRASTGAQQPGGACWSLRFAQPPSTM